jgi:hypothetical protein
MVAMRDDREVLDTMMKIAMAKTVTNDDDE